jgi:hypothetical protein
MPLADAAVGCGICFLALVPYVRFVVVPRVRQKQRDAATSTEDHPAMVDRTSTRSARQARLLSWLIPIVIAIWAIARLTR